MIFKTSLVNYRIGRENKRIFLNEEEILGAQNVQISSKIPFSPTPHLGMLGSSSILRGQPVGNVSIQSLLVNKDYFINYTGDQSCTGFLLDSKMDFFDEHHISFNPCYMTSYSCRYNDGSIPETSAEFEVFGSFGSFNWDDYALFRNSPNIYNSDPSYTLKIPNRGSINLTLDTYTTNRVQGFEIGVETKRIPKYCVGRSKPYQVVTAPPININCGFQFAMGQYTMTNIEYAWATKQIKNITLTINDYSTSEQISTYSFSDLDIVSQNLSFNTSNEATMSLQLAGSKNL